MTISELIYSFGTLCVIMADIFAHVFVFIYSRRHWRDTIAGTNMMYATIGIMVSFTWYLWSMYRTDAVEIDLADNVMRSLTFFLTSIVLFHRLYALYEVGKERKRTGSDD